MAISAKAYWAWLQLALGAGSFKPFKLLQCYPNVQSFYEAGEAEWRSLGLFTPKEINKLCSITLTDGQALLDESEKQGLKAITPDCSMFPERLRELENPPCVLYVKGTLPNVDEHPAIAVVGTRDATEIGEQITYDLSMQLAKAGMVIISGGARGIDTAAHLGGLQGQGANICVLGCGIGYPYLMENDAMRQQIVKFGAVLSEFPLNTPAFKSHFPIRNRIISGLSVGVLVVEAAERSGSLITARAALEQNRDVFAVPCGIYNPVSEGVNNLLKAGAKPVTKAQDILEEYVNQYSQLKLDRIKAEKPTRRVEEDRMLYKERNTPKVKANTEKAMVKALPTESLSADGALVFKVLSDEPLHISQLEQLTGLPTQRVLIAITELELCETIASHSGRRYSLPI